MAEHGGWLHELLTIGAVDKELDQKPEKNHKFLAQRETLLRMKQDNPKCRVTSGNNALKETITVQEERRTGMKAPTTRWMRLDKYEKKFGKANPAMIRSNMIDGKMVSGVDFIHPDESGSRCKKFLVVAVLVFMVIFCNSPKYKIRW